MQHHSFSQEASLPVVQDESGACHMPGFWVLRNGGAREDGRQSPSPGGVYSAVGETGSKLINRSMVSYRYAECWEVAGGSPA